MPNPYTIINDPVMSWKSTRQWTVIIILGLSGQALSAFVESKIAETKEIERLTSGAWRLKTNSAWVPTGELVMKPGEKFETELPGMNKQIYL